MPGLSTSLVTTANALHVFDRALATIQNNVSNALTPGYARQRLPLEPLPFDPDYAATGGVMAGELESARSEYAEQAVRRSQQEYGRYSQTAAELARVEPLFDVTGNAGIPAALDALFQSFSSWSVAPNDLAARQLVLDRAAGLAAQINTAASGVLSAQAGLDQPIQAVIGSINRLAGELHALNTQVREDIRNSQDPTLDARYCAVLEELAEYVDFTAVRQQDGTVTALLGGQTPLVLGGSQFAVSADVGGGALAIRDSQGRDITTQVGGGRLAALIETRNVTLPSYVSALNRLAAAVADQVNATLASGVDSASAPGRPLFAYDAGAGAAMTLHTTAIAPAGLAAALPGAPGGNGNALNLAGLAGSQPIDGYTLAGFYSALATQVGQDLAIARERQQTHEQVLTQVRSLRADASGVSLDEEAARLAEFQRAYEAAARVFTAIDGLLETTIAMLQ